MADFNFYLVQALLKYVAFFLPLLSLSAVDIYVILNITCDLSVLF